MVNTNLAYKEEIFEKASKVQIAESPVKWTTVSLHDVIKHGKRLEASVFDIETRRVRKSVYNNKYGFRYLAGEEGFVTAYVRPRFKRIWLKSSDLPIFQPSSITEIKPVPDGYLSHKTDTDIDTLRVHKGQILMTCSGSVGKVALVNETLDRHIFSHDLLRITCKNSEETGYVYAFCKSSSGQQLITSNNYGAVITHIEPEHLEKIPIPDAPAMIKRTIHDLIMRSYDLRDESNELIDDATNLLIDALELPALSDFDVKLFRKQTEVETFSVPLSSIEGRLDGSYHVPLIDAIIKHFEKHAAEVTTIGDSRISKEVILPGRFKRVYVEEGYGVPFFGGRSIGSLDPSDKKYLSLAQHSKKIKDELTIRENMVLVTCSGTIGNSAFVPKHWDRWAMTHDIIRIIPQPGIEGYLYIFLNSEYGNLLVRRFSYGSVVPHIEREHIEKVCVPLLSDKNVQQKINEMALKANELRYQAYMLEKKALQIMEEDVFENPARV